MRDDGSDEPSPRDGRPDTGSQGRGDDRSEDFDERVDRARSAIERPGPASGSEQRRQFTTDRRSLDTRVRYQWGVWTTVGVVLLSLVATAILVAVGGPVETGLVVFPVLLVLGLVLVHLRYRRWVFQVRTDALYLERGVFTHRRTLVPYVRIQHVDTSRSPIERALGLSTLVVYTAGSRGADVSIPGLTPEEARDLQGRVKELAIEADGGDAL